MAGDANGHGMEILRSEVIEAPTRQLRGSEAWPVQPSTIARRPRLFVPGRHGLTET
jgi:hypothetical protein